MRARNLSMTTIGVIATLVGFLVTVVAFSGVFRKPFEGDKATVVADFERAPQLRAGDQVRISGNIEGKVAEVEPAPRGDEARVTLELDDDAGPVYRDARARLRVKTLLGGAFYVALDRGSESAGPLGERVITSDRTSAQVEIEDLTDVFRAGAIRGFQTMPGELATALEDEAPPADAFRAAGDVAPDATTAVRAARGEEPGEDLPELVAATADTVEALDSDASDVRTLVSGAAATLGVTQRRAAEIRATIDAGPAVAGDLTTTLARLDGTLDRARGLVRRLDRSASALAPTLAALRPALTDTDRLLDTAQPALRTLTHAEDALAGTSPRANELIDRLQPALQRLDETILPYIGREDPITGHKTSVMIGGTAAGFGGASGQQDGNGHFIRFPASIGASSAYIPCTSRFIDPNATSELACDQLNDALETYMRYVPPLFQPSGAAK